MFSLLIICGLFNSFNWYPYQGIEGYGYFQSIANSPQGNKIIFSYGKENVMKRVIALDEGVFKGGDMVLFPKRWKFEIVRTPRNLEFRNSGIRMKYYDRFVAVIEKGNLYRKWKNLTRTEMAVTGNEDHMYFSFVVIRMENRDYLIPIVLSLDPLEEEDLDALGGVQ